MKGKEISYTIHNSKTNYFIPGARARVVDAYTRFAHVGVHARTSSIMGISVPYMTCIMCRLVLNNNAHLTPISIYYI